MPDDGTLYLCERCGEAIRDENDPSLVRARELIETPTFEDGHPPVEGLGVFFHAKCWRPSPRYRRVEQH